MGEQIERVGLGTVSPRGAGAEALAGLPEPLLAALPQPAEAGFFIGRYLLGDHCVRRGAGAGGRQRMKFLSGSFLEGSWG